MKKLLLFVIAFGFISVKAQQWCMPGAVWNYSINTIYPTITGYQEMRYVDTVTRSGRLCQQLDITNYETWVSWGNTPQTGFRSIYTNLQNQVLTYESAPNRFDTIAVFNARPGTHWYAYGHQASTNPATLIPQYTVHDTGHAVINGINLKYLTVAIGDSVAVFTPSNSIYLHRIYERFGNAHLFLYLQSVPPVLDAIIKDGSFTCYWDNAFPVYAAPNSRCNYNVISIKEQDAEKAFSSYPNPAKGIFTIVCDNACILSICGADGKLVKTAIHSGGKTELDVSELPAGIYFVKATINGSFHAQKLLVE